MSDAKVDGAEAASLPLQSWMQPAAPRSVSRRFLPWASAAYLLIALATSVVVLAEEYRAARNDLLFEFTMHEAALRQPLASALLGPGTRALETVVEEIATIPRLTGIIVTDHSSRQVLLARGIVEDGASHTILIGKDGVVGPVGRAIRLIRHTFPVVYRYEDRSVTLGEAELFADTAEILRRVASRAAIVVGALIIQAAALWLMFTHLTRRTLSQPLARLIERVDGVGLDRGNEVQLREAAGGDELTVLEDAVAEMTRRVSFEFRRLVEGSIQGMIVLQDGKARFANQAAAEMLGIGRPEDLVALPSMLDFLPSKGWKRAAQLCERLQAKAGATLRLSVPAVRRDGTETWLQVHVQQIHWRGKPGLMAALMDITPLKRAQAELETSERCFRQMFTNHRAIMVLVDPKSGQIRDVNLAAQAFYGYEREEFLSLNLSMLDTTERLSHSSSRERRHRLKDGTVRSVEVSETPITIGDGLQVQFAIVQDITERRRMEDELRRQATYDPLTGVVNRRHFLDRGITEIDRRRRYRHPLSLLMLDLDRFKLINDAHGHAAGDVALKQVVKILTPLLRETDVLARVGGEEFVALLPDTDCAGATILAERLRKAVAETAIAAGGVRLPVTVSIGIASDVGESEEIIEEAMDRADGALYRAKNAGRNRVELAKPPRPLFGGDGI
ncbi:MAG: diguanylate cyclase [Rhodospirillaceae bacterium]|nr:diguanylate cyclase [Rhodospirillales bacterium]